MTDTNLTDQLMRLKAEARQRIAAIEASIGELTTEKTSILEAFPDLGVAVKPKAPKKPRAPKGSVAEKVKNYLGESGTSVANANATVIAGEIEESISSVRAALRKLAA